MQRYFINENKWFENRVIITGEDHHHITHVMRMEINDKIIVNKHDGQAALGKITEITDNKVEAVLVKWLPENRELPVEVSIAQGLPKGDKWEFILQKGTELGAHHFVPFQADRSIVKWDSKKLNKKAPRWNKIVKEASEQSHRNIIPTVDTVLAFDQLMKKSSTYDWKFFAYEESARRESTVSLHEHFSQIGQGGSIIVVIGPEGGFTEEEASRFKREGFQSVRLGPRILRTETAPLYVLSSLSYYFEEMR